jgi:hypothetical protein
MVLAQTEDQYPFATVYDQELGFYSFKQESLSNLQWYERLNTNLDVGDTIGVTHQHKVLLEYVAQELHNQDFGNLSAAEQLLVRDDAKERYVSYAFLRQIGTQHGNLKVNLQNYFTKGDNCYPNNHQQTMHLLDKYSNTVVACATQYEGTDFAQIGGRGGGCGRASEKAKTPTLTIISGERKRNATSFTRKYTQRTTAPRSRPRTTTIDPWRAPSAALINSRRI